MEEECDSCPRECTERENDDGDVCALQKRLINKGTMMKVNIRVKNILTNSYPS